MDIAIPVGFLILATILLWFFINSKGRLSIKVGLTLLAGYYSLVTWHSLGSYKGWPSDDKMPEEFQLHWIVVKEPNKKTSDPGMIYVWLTTPDTESKNIFNFLGYKSSDMEPRIFKVPYSIKMHEQAEKARGMLMKGKVVRGKKSGKGGAPGEGPIKDGKQGSGNTGRNGSISQEQEYEFHELLPSKLPEK